MTPPAQPCSACQAPLATEARYCHRCGRATAAADRAPWLMAWSLVALSIALIVWFVESRDAAAGRPEMANVGAPADSGAPPDISQMSPEERFLRLSDRIESSLARGDSGALERFAPMALAAYQGLDRPGPDLRYHAGVLLLRLGEAGGALALADTIAREASNHLMADMLRAEAAEATGDRSLLAGSRRNFLAHYEAQIAAGRPEYREHQELLEAFRRRAGP